MGSSRHRGVVPQVVRSTFEHPTAEWIHVTAPRRRLPRIGLGAAYRNPEVLVEGALIREVHGIDDAVRFGWNTGAHHHVPCLSRGRVSELPASVDRAIEDRALEPGKH